METAHSLSVDLVTAEVVSALRDRGVRSILLKGPAIVKWLYADGALRPYDDSDLLIATSDLSTAKNVLLEMGFRYGYESLGPGQLQEGLFWARGHEMVDLHSTIYGVGAEPARVWAVLSRQLETAKVGGIEVEILAPPARAMLVALHAARHGRAEPRPITDLQRALEQVPSETWKEAAELAKEIEAAPAFATGLSLVAGGETLVRRLGLEKDTSVDGLLAAATAPTVAFTLEELRTTPGLLPKARFVARKTFPSPTYMRFVSPLARHGAAGLIVAYCLRIVQKSRAFIPALSAWFRARRESR
jgi:hypothetical protein